MTQQDLDASNRPILRLKTSKNTDTGLSQFKKNDVK